MYPRPISPAVKEFGWVRVNDNGALYKISTALPVAATSRSLNSASAPRLTLSHRPNSSTSDFRSISEEKLGLDTDGLLLILVNHRSGVTRTCRVIFATQSGLARRCSTCI